MPQIAFVGTVNVTSSIPALARLLHGMGKRGPAPGEALVLLQLESLEEMAFGSGTKARDAYLEELVKVVGKRPSTGFVFVPESLADRWRKAVAEIVRKCC